MGTNYYLESVVPDGPCPCCHRVFVPERLHIGKSSAGWCFSLHVIPEKNLNNLDDWKVIWHAPNWKIVDEYGRGHSVNDLEDTIQAREWPYPRGEAMLLDAYTTAGPNGLLRHRVGNGCIAHGEGTWDLISDDFS